MPGDNWSSAKVASCNRFGLCVPLVSTFRGGKDNSSTFERFDFLVLLVFLFIHAHHQMDKENKAEDKIWGSKQ